MSLQKCFGKTYLTCVLSVLLVAIPCIRSVSAQSDPAAAFQVPTTAKGTIERLMTLPNGSIYVRLKGVPIINPGRCATVYWYGFVNGGNPEGASRMLATLLTARASELNIRLGISGTECLSNIPKIVSVLLEPN